MGDLDWQLIFLIGYLTGLLVAVSLHWIFERTRR